jgi:hypothetical protein
VNFYKRILIQPSRDGKHCGRCVHEREGKCSAYAWMMNAGDRWYPNLEADGKKWIRRQRCLDDEKEAKTNSDRVAR